MKRIIPIALLCGLLLAGCGKTDDSSSGTSSAPAEKVTSGETATETAPAEIVPADWDIPEDILQPDREPFEVEMNGETVTIVPETPAYYMVSSSDALKKKFVTYFDANDNPIKNNLLGSSSESIVYKCDENGKILSTLRFEYDDGEYSFEGEETHNYRSDGTLETIVVTKDGEVTNTSHYDEHENWLYNDEDTLGISTRMEYEYAEDGKSYKEKYYSSKDGSKPTMVYEYTLNDKGDPITKTADIGTVTEFTYDADGKCLKSEEKYVKDDGSENIFSSTVYSYDQQGRKLKEETTSTLLEEENKSVIEYHYYK